MENDCYLERFNVKTMGQTQTFPLPSRIPVPTSGQLAKLNEMGITIGDEIEGYALYTMPEGWKMKSKTIREDMPNFVMVDSNGDIRVEVSGVWKGTYDNKLWLMIKKAPYTTFEHREIEIVKSETSCSAITDKLVTAFATDFDEKRSMSHHKMY
jgi:hypothetical protein